MYPNREMDEGFVVDAATPHSTPVRGVKGGSPAAPPLAPPPAPPAPAAAPPPPSDEPPRRGPGATAGIVLITIGAVFLAAQFIPGIAWWSLWPLVIVGAGVYQGVTPGKEGWGVNRLFDGLSTAAFGLVLLAVTTGYVGFDVFWRIISLWPLFVIALGLELLGKATHTSWVRALGSIVVIGVLVFSVGVSAGQVADISVSTSGSGESASISEPVGMVREGDLKLEAGVANVTLRGGSALVDAEAVSPWGQPVFTVTRSGQQADVTLSTGSGSASWVWPGNMTARMDAEIARRVLWDVVLEAGVSALDADLSDVTVRSLALEPGVADAKVRLGPVPTGVQESTVLVESGVSSVRIEIPAGAFVRIESDSGLTGHDIDDAFESVGSRVWETPGIDEARASGRGVWDITIKSGIGSIEVDTY